MNVSGGAVSNSLEIGGQSPLAKILEHNGLSQLNDLHLIYLQQNVVECSWTIKLTVVCPLSLLFTTLVFMTVYSFPLLFVLIFAGYQCPLLTAGRFLSSASRVGELLGRAGEVTMSVEVSAYLMGETSSSFCLFPGGSESEFKFEST
jgi:hypothetical protein